jgi:hypothetical protein
VVLGAGCEIRDGSIVVVLNSPVEADVREQVAGLRDLVTRVLVRELTQASDCLKGVYRQVKKDVVIVSIRHVYVSMCMWA